MTIPEIIVLVLVNCLYGPIDPPAGWVFPAIWIGFGIMVLVQTRARPGSSAAA